MTNLPLNIKFESERYTVIANMSKSESDVVRSLAQVIFDMTQRDALKYRDANPEIWDRYLLDAEGL